MTHHTHPYVKIPHDTDTFGYYDKRQRRRQRRRAGQFTAILRSTGRVTIDTATAVRRQAAATREVQARMPHAPFGGV